MVKQFCLSFVILLVGLSTGRVVFGATYSYVDVTVGAGDTVVHGINNAGSVVGTYADNINVVLPLQPGWNAFVRTGAVVTTLNPPFNALGAEAAAINNQGVVVGNYLFEVVQEGVPATYTHGFIWNGSTYTDIAYPGGWDTAISDIDDAGVIVGFFSEDFGLGVDVYTFGFRAFPDGSGGYVFDPPIDLSDEDPNTLELTFLNGRNLMGKEVATVARLDLTGGDAGDVYGVLLPQQPQETEVRFPNTPPNVTTTTLSDINNNGIVVGRATIGDANERFREVGFLVDSADVLSLPAEQVNFVDLQLPGTACTFGKTQLGLDPNCHKSVQQINDNNVIAGFYDNGDGVFRGFIGTPNTTLDGDFNNDGRVDAADYVVWRRSGGTLADYQLWRANFGNTGAGAALGGSVPEPSAILLTTFGLILVFGLIERPKNYINRS